MRIRLTGRGHAAGLLSELNRCRLSRRYCDVFLQVGNRSFCAHRAVLACSGTYFQNLLARTPNTPTTTTTSAFSLEFISPANFEKVLTFVYTGEISTDLIDVGTLYELAERLGVSELVKACHSTFPDLQTNCTDIALDSGSAVSVSGVNAASVCASSACSSAASCSSLSSSTAPTPAAAAAAAGAPPSPLCQAGMSREETEAVNTGGGLTLELKAEEVQCHIGYGQMATDHNQQLQGDHHQLPGGHSLLTSSHSSQSDGPRLILKTEQVEGEETGHSGGTGGRGGTVCEDGTRDRRGVSGTVPSGSCSFPDSSAQLQVPSSGEPLSSLQVGSVTGGVMFTEGEDTDHEADKEALHGNPLHGNIVMEGAEEEWNQLTDDIIELSDDETYLEEEEEEEEEEEGDLVCVENGETGNPGRQMPEPLLSCKVCSAPLPADPSSISKHSETHLTELGLCRVCGVSFQDRPTAVSHSLSHVGVQLYSCDMCNTQFLSLNKLLRHHRQTACSYTIPQGALSNSNQGLSPELQCAVCNKTLSKDFQTVRDHALSHVCPQSLRCGLCDVPLLSLCSLLWHCLSHLSLPVYSCPHCARCFTERPQLDRHMATHAAEAVARETERSLLRAIRIGGDGNGDDVIRGGGANTTTEELHCFLCPQTFRTSAAFQYHLSLHTSDSLGGSGGGGGQSWLGKRKADQSIESTCSSSSPRDSGGLLKMSNLGLGLGVGVGGFSVPDKFFQGSLQSLTNGGLGQDAGGASRGKWYRCRYCGKRFAHSGEFTYHLRIHTGEKPYQCKVCLRFFRGRSTMICHLKTHAGALMYRCTVCGLYFSTLKLVASHMELHKDNLPADFHIEQTFMYNDHSKEPLPTGEA